MYSCLFDQWEVQRCSPPNFQRQISNASANNGNRPADKLVSHDKFVTMDIQNIGIGSPPSIPRDQTVRGAKRENVLFQNQDAGGTGPGAALCQMSSQGCQEKGRPNSELGRRRKMAPEGVPKERGVPVQYVYNAPSVKNRCLQLKFKHWKTTLQCTSHPFPQITTKLNNRRNILHVKSARRAKPTMPERSKQ